ATFEVFRLCETPHPPRDARTPIERTESALMVIVFHDVERRIGELDRPHELAVERRRRLCKRRQSTALDVPRAVDSGFLCQDRHLVAYDRKVTELPRGASRKEPPPECRLQLDRAEQQLACGQVRLARKPALSGRLQRLRRGLGKLLGRMAVELRVEPRRLVEVEGADLEHLLLGSPPPP